MNCPYYDPFRFSRPLMSTPKEPARITIDFENGDSVEFSGIVDLLKVDFPGIIPDSSLRAGLPRYMFSDTKVEMKVVGVGDMFYNTPLTEEQRFIWAWQAIK